jgi:hypothetical protein
MNDLQQLKTARAVLAVLEGQAAGYTVLTIPAHLKIELDAKREQVAALEARLAALQTGSASAAPPDRATLHRKLAEHFNVDEMRLLCFELGIQHENLSDRRASMAMEIVEHCERYVMTDQLVAACRRIRPQVSW